jgi:integrase
MPKLSFFPLRQCGRVRIPGRGIVYLGKAGCWPSKTKPPPPEVVEEYQRQVMAWFSTRAEAVPAGEHLAAGCTIGELVAVYLAYAKHTFRKRGKPTTHYSGIKDAVRPLIALFASMPAEKFSPADLRALRDQLEREGRWNRGNINSALGRIRKMFQWGAAERDLFSTDVWLRLKSVSGLLRHRTTARESQTDKPVLASLVDATLPHLPLVAAAMVRLQQVTGMRPIEVCWMRASEITEEADGLWKYVASDEGNKLAHKGIAKIVYLGPKARRILKPWLKRARKVAANYWVFPKRNRGKNGNMKPHYYGSVIRETCDAHGLKRWHPRQLRHSRGTEVRKGYTIEGAQAVLGHTAPEMTERYISSALEDLARKIAKESG